MGSQLQDIDIPGKKNRFLKTGTQQLHNTMECIHIFLGTNLDPLLQWQPPARSHVFIGGGHSDIKHQKYSFPLLKECGHEFQTP